MSNSLKNFGIRNAIMTTVSVTDTTQTIALGADRGHQEDIMIINPSTTLPVFVRTGDENVVADANAMRVMPGEKGVYSRGGRDATHIAFIASAPVTIQFILGGGV